LLTATALLGLGIMLGAYWAYGVLGWGGYWGWDPVENSSLVPWITGIALLHTMLAQLRTGKYVRTNFTLAIISFLLVIYSTFLTRSGILGDASVHSFTDPGATVYWLLVAFMVLITGSGIAAMVARRRELVPPATDTMILSRETSLATGSLALILSAAVILFGTSLPIFSTTRVEPSFYDTTHFPIAIAIGLLIGFSLFTQWEMQDGRESLRRSATSIGISLLLVAVLFVLGVRNILVLLFMFSALFAFFVNAEIAVKVARGDWRFLGGKITHMGMAIFLLGVISVGKFSTVERVPLQLNTPTDAVGHRLTFTGSRTRPDGKVEFNIHVDADGKSLNLAPVMYEAGEQGLMRNPDIASTLTRDFYISPIQYDRGETAGSRETYKLSKGETVAIGNVRATFVGFDMGQHDPSVMGGGGGMAVGSILELSAGAERERITPLTVYQQGQSPQPAPVQSRLINASVVLLGMNIGMGETPSSVTLGVQRSVTAATGGVLTVEASVKPYINLLWAGTLMLMMGFGLSIVKRSKEV
jgi:cytochrome c-type biogenesis protein CcmF